MSSIPATLLGVLAFALPGLAQTSAPMPYLDVTLSPERRAVDLVHRMTEEEKVAQTINTASAIPRLNVAAYDYWSEGLHGIARSGYATMFPQAIGMAATFNAPLLGKMGETVATEARAKYQDAMRRDIHSIYYGLTIWSPNINIFRDPRWGRGQETYGEDPFLTARLGVRFVNGLQGSDPNYYRTIATPKHYAVHSGPESTRHSADIEPTRHDLWDTYLPAFRATVTEAHAGSVMCAYNALDGAPACASRELLVDILRRDWGFRGFVTSDCGAIDDFYVPKAHHTSPDPASAAAVGIKMGTDTNCGTTYLALPEALRRGLVTQGEIDTSLVRLFAARMRLGMFDPEAKVPYASVPYAEVDSPAHRALAHDAANQSMVLLRNEDHALPLNPARTRSIAVIGPNAASLSALEGNYNAIPRDPVLAVDGFGSEFPGAKVLYSQGAPYAEGVALPAPRTLFHTSMTSETEGLKAEYFSGAGFDSAPVLTRTDRQIDFDWSSASPVAGLDASRFAVRWTGAIAVPAAGEYGFGVRFTECAPCTEHERFAVFLDGKQIAASPDAAASKGRDERTPRFGMQLPDTRRHELRVEYTHDAPLFGAGIAFEWIPPSAPLLAEAVALAKQADVVVAFVGLTRELEGEEMPLHVEGFAGGDRTDIKLPQTQERMLEALGATGKPLIVVLMNGSALAVNWAKEHASAILEAWYPGEEGARSIAETLSGRNNPGGRLPVTFYTGTDQLPAFEDYAMANRTYRYFKGEPLFGFGFGMSYTTFGYSGLKLSSAKLHAGDPLEVEAEVKNTGSVAGDEVAELYLTAPKTAVSARYALVGFERVHLRPGEMTRVRFTLDPRTLSQVDEAGVRAVRAGEYKLSIGGSQPGPETLSSGFAISGSQPIAR